MSLPELLTPIRVDAGGRTQGPGPEPLLFFFFIKVKGGAGVQRLSDPGPGVSKGAAGGVSEPNITQRVLECSSGMFLPPFSYLVPETLTEPILQEPGSSSQRQQQAHVSL